MIELADGQFELLASASDDDDGLHFGAGTPIPVQSFDPAPAEDRNADANRPMADGIAFGRDFRNGRAISIEMTAVSWTPAVAAEHYGPTPGLNPAAEALEIAERIETAWSSDRVRLSPGAVQVLRWSVGGRERRVYGRPRRCAPKTTTVHAGTVPFVADFQTEDDLYYSDDRRVITIPIVPSSNAWTLWPLTWPVYWYKAGSATSNGTVTVGGTRATWPSFTIHGPVANPEIVVGGYGSLKLNTTLLYDQSLYLDTRPWNRGVRRSDGANLAGALDVRSTPLTMLRIPPGTYSVGLDGHDPTGTASLVVECRDAYSSW
jgi:hypothetical protein